MTSWSLAVVVGVFAASALLIAGVGAKFTQVADELSERTQLGGFLFGALFVGVATSLPELVTTLTASMQGHAELAIANAIGGVAGQTAFLGVADAFYRRANLEHAVVGVENLLQPALLIALLALPLLASTGPHLAIAGLHPVSYLLVLGAVLGVWLIRQARAEPMWEARTTAETQEEQAYQGPRHRLWVAWLLFAGLGLVVAVAAYFVAETGIGIADRTGLSETAVGMVLTGLAGSLPELVTAVAAVRRGAVNLAMGNILGGNTFDVVFVALADGVYREGSIYHLMARQQVFIIALTILLTAVLLLGLIRRERRGVARIGFESVIILVLYAAGVGLLLFG